MIIECCHSSVDSSAPTILPPRVRVPSTPSMLLSFIVKFVLYLSCEKNEINKKRPGLAHFFIKKYDHRVMNKKYTTPLPYSWDVEQQKDILRRRSQQKQKPSVNHCVTTERRTFPIQNVHLKFFHKISTIGTLKADFDVSQNKYRKKKNYLKLVNELEFILRPFFGVTFWWNNN